jgi:phage shock protein E
LTLLLVLLLNACTSMQKSEQVTWIDVRTPAEYAEKHVAQATNIPYTDIVAGMAQLDLARDAPIYLYCGSGRRAGLAQQALEAEGYSNVSNLGGLDEALSRAHEAE